jgi:hypothetical protein
MTLSWEMKWIAQVTQERSLDDRVERLRQVSEGLIDAALSAVSSHELNRVVVFSEKVASKIPLSYAGVAFRSMARGLLEVEALRISRLWDRPSFERTSIPTAYALLMTDGVLGRLQGEVANSQAAIERGDSSHIERHGRQCLRLRRLVPAVDRSDLKNRVTNFRDKHVAHILRRTASEASGALPGIKGRELTRLLNRSIAAVDLLNCVSRQSSFDWKGASANAKLYSEELWHNVEFNVPDYRRQ